jgi:hypothetical protein
MSQKQPFILRCFEGPKRSADAEAESVSKTIDYRVFQAAIAAAWARDALPIH